MSAVATPAKRLERRPARTPGCTGGSPFDDRATLEGSILSAWEGVVVEGRCACPVCGGAMVAGGCGASCKNCGSELS